jgi:ankyrin repeat protein
LDLSKKDNINIRIDIFDSDGRTLLYNCVKFNYYDLCKTLIEYNKTTIGISIINIKDVLGYTSLHYAIIFNNLNLFKLLLENNADPYICGKDGNNS